MRGSDKGSEIFQNEIDMACRERAIVDVLSGDSCGSKFYVRNSVILHTIGKISVRGVE